MSTRNTEPLWPTFDRRAAGEYACDELNMTLRKVKIAKQTWWEAERNGIPALFQLYEDACRFLAGLRQEVPRIEGADMKPEADWRGPVLDPVVKVRRARAEERRD